MQIAVKRFNQLMEHQKKSRKKMTSIEIANKKYYFKWNLALHTFYHKGTTCVCCQTKSTHYEVTHATHHGKARVIVSLKTKRKDGTIIPMTMDHIIPKSRGGQTTAIGNLQAMCEDCNQEKSNTLPSEEIMNGVKRWWKNRIPHNLKIQFEQELLTLAQG